jgi:hypothetical protein
MTPKFLVAATVALAAVSAVVQTSAEAEDGAAGRAIYLAAAQEACESNGVMFFEDRDEWPTTKDGRQAIEVVRERCAKNPKSFAANSVAMR